MDRPKMICIRMSNVPFFQHLFYEYYVYVDSDDYKADDIFAYNKVSGTILGEWMHPGEKYRLIYIRIKKKCVKIFEESMELLARKQLISGNNDYLENAEHLCNQLARFIKKATNK